MEIAGRIGWTARGLLYLVVATLVARLPSTGGRQQEADQKGAFATLVESRFGGALLVIVALGLLLFAVWRAWAAIRMTDEKWTRRLAWSFSAVIYVELFLLAIGVLRGSGGTGDKQAMTARVLEWPGGPALVGLVGIIIFGIAANAVRKGVKERFFHDIDERAVPSPVLPIVRVLGVVGWLARSVVGFLLGWFIVQAAWQHDPSEPVGLDASLRKIVLESWGTTLLWVAAVGLAAYGLLCLATAAWFDPPDGARG